MMDSSHQLQPETNDCANCPACRTRALIYRELVDLKFPMILPIAQTVVSEMSTDLLDEFGGAEHALNSILLTAAEEHRRTTEAGGCDKGLAYLAHNAEDLHFNDHDIAILLSVAKSLAASSRRLKHRG
jgi:hypothetical protein